MSMDLTDIIRRLEMMDRRLRKLETRDQGRRALAGLSDVTLTFDMIPSSISSADRGAILAWRDTGWDALFSLRYRVEVDIDHDNVVPIMPDDTVEHALIATAIVIGTTTAPATVTNWFEWAEISVSSSALIYSDTGQELTLAVTGTGSITLQRTDGDITYDRVKLFLFWE